MPGRHSPSAETQEHIYIAENAPRGKHTRTRGRRRRQGPINRATKITVAGLAAAAVAGTVAYGAVSAVGRNGPITTASQINVAAPTRSGDERAARSGGYCGRTGPGQARVERYLANETTRFGQVIADAKQDAVDCTAIKKFQTAIGLPTVTGFADDATAQVADRLHSSVPTDCQPSDSVTTVCVDLTHQTLWVMRAGSLVLHPVVMRSGGKGLTTPVGDFQISEKKQITVSSEYGTPLPYWQRFHEDFGLHAADTSIYTTNDGGSHGCVNLLKADAQTVYSLTRIGTEVHVFGQKAGT